MSRPRLGHDVFPRGMPEGLAAVTVPVYELGLFELLRAYGENRRRAAEAVLTIQPSAFHSVEEALKRLGRFDCASITGFSSLEAVRCTRQRTACTSD